LAILTGWYELEYRVAHGFSVRQLAALDSARGAPPACSRCGGGSRIAGGCAGPRTPWLAW